MRRTMSFLWCMDALLRLPRLWCGDHGDAVKAGTDATWEGAPDESLVPHGESCRFEPREGQLTVVTHDSVWLIRPGAYCRTPRDERPRPPEPSDDGRWHAYRKLWWSDDGWALRLRILPVAGPADGHGVYSENVLAVYGTWAIVDEPAPATSHG